MGPGLTKGTLDAYLGCFIEASVYSKYMLKASQLFSKRAIGMIYEWWRFR